VDIRDAKWYTTWKSGVELKLYAFQHARSRAGSQTQFVAATPTLPWDSIGDILPSENKWEELDLDANLYDETAELNELPRYQPNKIQLAPPTAAPSTTETPKATRPCVLLKLGAAQINAPIPPATIVRARPHYPVVLKTKPAYTPNATAPDAKYTHSPTGAGLFMQSRPGGPIAAKAQIMKVAERKVSSSIQKKGTTSVQGHNALQTIATNTASYNKENQPETTPGIKRKCTGKRKAKTTPTPKVRTTKTSTTKTTTTTPKSTTMAPKAKMCNYGCTHGAWVGLKQMMPYDTKYCLEKGNYLYGKNCVDCKDSIGSVFQRSKNKALLYYCQVDYNVFELSDDNQEKEEQPCGCILCLTCYYKREETKKKQGGGKTTRSSGRGRG
jgi:hypothetical protein